jgi:hypothetical protein
MVEDRITDGKRIAQLLASELTGLETPPLNRVSVVDSTPDVEPTPNGVKAYGVAVDGDRVGTVTVSPDHAQLSFTGTRPDDTAAERDGVQIKTTSETIIVRIENGAAVKSAVDVLAETLAE